MWSFLGNVIVPAAVAGIFGVVSWIVINFFADPLLSFYRRRRAIHESLLYVANINEEISLKKNIVMLTRKCAGTLQQLAQYRKRHRG